MSNNPDRELTEAQARVNAYIDEKMVHGDPFYVTTSKDATDSGSVVNIMLSNHNPLGLAVFKIVMRDGSTVKAFMSVAGLTRKIGSICATLELLGHKHIVHDSLKVAMHGNTNSGQKKEEAAPEPNGTMLPAAVDEEELDQRKAYENWVREKEKDA